MTEKTPDFVERVEEKFKPRIKMMWKRRDYNRPYCMLLGINDVEKMIPMGGKVIKEDDRGSPVIRFKGIDGEYVDWIALYDSPQPCLHGDLYLTSGSDKEGRRYQGHYACEEGGGILVCVPSSREEEEIGKKVAKIIGLSEWQNCHDFYAKKYQEDKAKFETTNLVWAKWKSIDTPEMRVTLSDTEYQALKNMYEAKLNREPDYRALQELKQDVSDLDNYVKYLKQEQEKEQIPERDGLEEKMEDITAEFNSDEMKAVIPDESRRLAVREIMRKTLKQTRGTRSSREQSKPLNPRDIYGY